MLALLLYTSCAIVLMSSAGGHQLHAVEAGVSVIFRCMFCASQCTQCEGQFLHGCARLCSGQKCNNRGVGWQPAAAVAATCLHAQACKP